MAAALTVTVAAVAAETPAPAPAVEAVATAWALKDRSAFEQWAAGLTDPGERGIARRADGGWNTKRRERLQGDR